MTIEELIEQGEDILNHATHSELGVFIDSNKYENWKRLALMFVQQTYPHHPQTPTFETEVQATTNSVKHCQALVAILKAFNTIKPHQTDTNHEAILDNLFNHFNAFARQLQRRYNNRATIKIEDEYDVQDLLHALFRLHFDDVRPEEWTPSYAGGSKRMDFLLKGAEIAVEVKKTREGLRDKEIGEQLTIDIANYKGHPNCKMLYCFVYDPDGMIRNPRGLENDLHARNKDFPVKVYIRPLD